MAENVGPEPVVRDGVYYSADGKWRWDGQQWVPVAPQAATAAINWNDPQSWLNWETLARIFFTGPQNRWYSENKRLGYGLLYAGWTVVLGLAFMNSLSKLTVSAQDFIASLVLAGLVFLAGSYAYRIWTWRARRLLFFIIF